MYYIYIYVYKPFFLSFGESMEWLKPMPGFFIAVCEASRRCPFTLFQKCSTNQEEIWEGKSALKPAIDQRCSTLEEQGPLK